jgi:hypothetical protein
MNSFPHGRLSAIRSRRTAGALGLLAALAALGMLAALARTRHSVQTPPPDADPRLTYAGPYRNVRPGVGYTGDEACAACHEQQARTYRDHPMSRSVTSVADQAGSPRKTAATHDGSFESGGFTYASECRDGRIVHRETRRDAQGRIVSEVSALVHYAIGSGTRGSSYLIDKGGYVLESPLSWFTQKGIWDLSPGFARGAHRFTRPITADCLFCHSNAVAPVEHVANRFQEPLFRGTGIGCERCHGPGQEHVARRQRGEDVAGPDDTIVNPGRLEPALRDAVCEQCHLQGEVRVLRRNRGLFDYRPGLPLHLFLSVFVRPSERADHQKAVTHVPQMHLSRCYRQSQGALGCVSCHDPHLLPAAADRVAYYRDRCLRCHQETSCGIPPEDQRRQNCADDCTSCHMPREKSSNIAHAAVTDHRIPRRAGPSAAPQPSATTGLPLVHFHSPLLAEEDEGLGRDLGIALMDLVKALPDAGMRLQFSRLASPRLEEAWRRAPEDVPALEARASALWVEGLRDSALASFEAALALAPDREFCLASAARLSAELDRPAAELAYWRRAVAANPWAVRYHVELAQALAKRDDWDGALEECQAAVELNPGDWEPRMLWVRCKVAQGKRDEARAELERVLGLNPPQPEKLRRWFTDALGVRRPG